MSQQARSIFSISFPVAPGVVTVFRGVDYAGAQATVQGQKIAGIANRGAASGAGYEATKLGSAIVEAGAAFAVGASLIMDAQGRAIASTGALNVKAGATAMTSTAANGAGVLGGGDPPEYVFADALQAAAQAGDLVEVMMR